MPDWNGIFFDFWHLLVAFVLVGVIGWNREEEEHNTGIRAFPIVAMASCTFVMIATFHGDQAAQSRVLQGLVAGIGFVGGGAIMKDGLNIKGTATAASVLSAAAMGASVALRVLAPVKNRRGDQAGKATRYLFTLFFQRGS